jgi:hypothetical protein
MTATTVAATSTDRAPVRVSDAARWTRGGRIAAAFTLIASGVFWVIADVIGFGASDELRYMAAHPTLSGLGVVSDTLAVPFLLGSVAVWVLLSRHASRKLAWIGAALLVCGLVGQAMLEGVEMIGYTVAQSGKLDLTTYSNVTNSPAGAPGIVFMLMFFIGAGLGIVLMMIAVWRSHAVPRTAAALPIVFQVAQTIGVPFPATVIMLVGVVWMAVAILRTRSTSAPTASASA